MTTNAPTSGLRTITVAPGDLATQYEYEDTRRLVALVDDAASLIRDRGEAAFADFRVPRSRWRDGERYIFVIDPDGTMLVHPDPAMKGSNQLELKDITGKPIVRGLIDAAMVPGKAEGWYHYQWPVPGGLMPRWKSSYVRLVDAPSGRHLVVGSGVYNDRMERAFVIDLVNDAVAAIEAHGDDAYPLLRDPTGPFIAKDAYVFVIDPDGVELVNPAFPTLEGRSLLHVKDAAGQEPIPRILDVARRDGRGWVDYMWPKPGDSRSTLKSTYVCRAAAGQGREVVVGCGVYLADAAPGPAVGPRMTASELAALVREAAAVLEQRGEAAYGEFAEKGSKWFRDDRYFFAITMDGRRCFHAADPDTPAPPVRDVAGRPVRQMMIDAAANPSGEGWVHYLYPQPGSLFPAWKSVFMKRVTFPSGAVRAIGCGIYNMPMDRSFIEDMVNRAAGLIAARGRSAFAALRDKAGPFVFMDTYVFVLDPLGNQLVNGGLPALEGRNLMNLLDLTGKAVAREEIAAALQHGSAWSDCTWYRPGGNSAARKDTFVRKVDAAGETFIVGSGVYVGA